MVLYFWHQRKIWNVYRKRRLTVALLDIPLVTVLQYDLMYENVWKRTVWEKNNPMETTWKLKSTCVNGVKTKYELILPKNEICGEVTDSNFT